MAIDMTSDRNGAFEQDAGVATGQTDADAVRANEAAKLHAERERVFRKAGRHTYFVRFLKVLLPIGAVGLVGLFGLVISANHYVPVREGDKFDIGKPVITRDGMVMENPKYEGFNEDGSKFFVTAKRATPDLKQPDRVAMNGISGTLTQPDGQRTHIKAARGFYDGKKGNLDLFDRIDIVSETGIKVQMNSAKIFIKENRVVTDQPVAAQMPTGQIRANSMILQTKKRLALFEGGVAVRVTPKPKTLKQTTATPASKASPAGIMGSSQAPIDVVSVSLNVDDNKKIAIFKGSVQAVQAGNKLTARELELQYEGKSAMPGASGNRKSSPVPVAPGAAPDGTRLKIIKARRNVVLTSDQGRRVTANNALFDALSETALLVGSVVITQGLNIVKSDRLKLNSKAQTALLTGHVRLEQGQNLLTGGRLFVNQKAATSRLTSPGRGGRIFATFYQKPKRGGAKAKARKAKLAKSRPSPLRFKSDPSAPIKIDAASLDVNDKVKSAIFKGKVVARQGAMKIRADVLVASYTGQTGMGAAGLGGIAARGGRQKGAAAQLKRVEARKNVIIESADGQTATGDRADFDIKGNTVVLSGNVVLKQGSTVIYGEKLLIDLNTGKTKIVPRRGGTSVSSWGGRDKPFGAGARSCPAGRTCLQLIPGQLQQQFKNQRKSNKGGGWNSTTLGLGGKRK